MAKLQIEARVHEISNVIEIPAKVGTGSFKKRELILDCSSWKIVDQTTGETKKYANYPKIEFRNRSVEKLADIGVGDKVRVSFDITGRYYEAKDGTRNHINGIDGYDCELLEKATVQPQQPQPQPIPQQMPQPMPQPQAYAPQQAPQPMQQPYGYYQQPYQQPHPANEPPF